MHLDMQIPLFLLSFQLFTKQPIVAFFEANATMSLMRYFENHVTYFEHKERR